jgi:hypothetical protein
MHPHGRFGQIRVVSTEHSEEVIVLPTNRLTAGGCEVGCGDGEQELVTDRSMLCRQSFVAGSSDECCVELLIGLIDIGWLCRLQCL